MMKRILAVLGLITVLVIVPLSILQYYRQVANLLAQQRRAAALDEDDEEWASGFGGAECPIPYMIFIGSKSRSVTEGHSFTIKIVLDHADNPCPIELHLDAPAFELSERNRTVTLQYGVNTIPWVLLPKSTGPQEIVLTVEGGRGPQIVTKRITRGFLVESKGLIGARTSEVIAILSTILGPAMTIPWWIGVHRRRRESRNVSPEIRSALVLPESAIPKKQKRPLRERLIHALPAAGLAVVVPVTALLLLATVALPLTKEAKALKAVGELTARGAVVDRGNPFGVGLTTSILIGPDWTGDDEDLELLRQVPDVATLYLTSPRLGNEALHYVAALSQLTLLTATSQDFSDEGLYGLVSLPRLIELDLSGTSITNEGVIQLVGAKSLRVLYLFDTRVTASGLDAFSHREDVQIFGPERP